jgi:hypothetical protein
MKKPAAFTALFVLASVLSAAAQDDRAAMARVRLTTDPNVPLGCTRIGLVRDDSIKDLRRKVVKAGGDTALLSFPAEDLEKIDAQVFRCPPHSVTPPRVPSHIPPPPPGPPPPGPPPPGPPPPPPPR